METLGRKDPTKHSRWGANCRLPDNFDISYINITLTEEKGSLF